MPRWAEQFLLQSPSPLHPILLLAQLSAPWESKRCRARLVQPPLSLRNGEKTGKSLTGRASWDPSNHRNCVPPVWMWAEVRQAHSCSVYLKWAPLLCLTNDIHCSTCLQCNRPEAAKWLYLKLKRKVQSFEVRRHIMNSAKLYISKAVLFAEAICPEKSSNMHLWQESKELRETDLMEDVSDHPFPQYLKCHFVVEQLPSLYQLQHLHPAPAVLLAFEETVQSSSSQQFLIRYANKTSLLVPPNGNCELSEALP